jgi:choline kinase/mannose-6-phosphate isomerase-like protein (cupin superfamily)/thiamine kinase-like enzyme
LALNDKYCYKRIEIHAGMKTSYQLHHFKLETNYIISGNAEVWLENDQGLVETFMMKEGDFFTVLPERKHRVIAITDLVLQEVSTPEVDDVVRLNDEFHRGDGKIEAEHCKPLLCIAAAGTGSRLLSVGESCHKTLIPFQNKAILTHIIERFKPDIDIVIAVGHLKEQIVEYVALFHADRNIQFVEVEPYSGEGSGPAYSLECCRAFLQKPFYFCVSDFYCDDFLQNETFSTENWLGVSPTTMSESYSTVKIVDGKVEQLIQKTEGGFPDAFTGIFYMYDYALFWKSLDMFVDSKKELVDVFQQIESFHFRPKTIDWKDVGTLELYHAFIEKYGNSQQYLHNTKHEFKYKKDGVFIKKIDSPHKIENLIRRHRCLQKFAPLSFKGGKHFLSYQYVEGSTLYDCNDKRKYLQFLDWFEQVVCLPSKIYNPRYSNTAYHFYCEKTKQRFQLFQSNREGKGDFLFLDSIQQVNETTVQPMQSYLDTIDWEQLSTIRFNPLFHGDLQFDNVIVSPETHFTLIDWREDFGGSTEGGDLYYDLAKLYGGMELNYSKMKDKTNFSCDFYSHNISCRLTQYRDPVLSSIQKNEFRQMLLRNRLDEQVVKLLTAIVFLNMAPLHIHGFDVFLFFKAKLLFEEIRKESIVSILFQN